MTVYKSSEGSGDAPAELAGIVAGVLAGQTHQEIADAMGLSPSTVRRRRKDPWVLRAVAEARDDAMKSMVARLTTLGAAALDVLRDLLGDPQPRIRLQAATLILNTWRAEMRTEPPAGAPSEVTFRDDVVADQKLAALMGDDAWSQSRDISQAVPGGVGVDHAPSASGGEDVHA